MAACLFRTVQLKLQIRQGDVQLSTFRGNVGRPFQVVARSGNVAAIETLLGQFNKALHKVVVAVGTLARGYPISKCAGWALRYDRRK